MTTSQSRSKVVETKYIWAPTIQEAMDMAAQMKPHGWFIEGNPAPMTLQGRYGTGISITRATNDWQ